MSMKFLHLVQYLSKANHGVVHTPHKQVAKLHVVHIARAWEDSDHQVHFLNSPVAHIQPAGHLMPACGLICSSLASFLSLLSKDNLCSCMRMPQAF